MKRAALLGLALLATPAAAEPYDIPWFQRNPQARAEWLRRCSDDSRMDPHICANARGAAVRGRLGSPMPREPTQWERELPDYLRFPTAPSKRT